MPVIDTAAQSRLELCGHVAATAPRALTTARALQVSLVALLADPHPGIHIGNHGHEIQRQIAQAITELGALARSLIDGGSDWNELPESERVYGGD